MRPRVMQSVCQSIQALHQLSGPAGVASDDQDRIVPRQRAYDLGQLGAVDRHGQNLRLARSRPQHDELLDALHARQELRGGLA